MSTLPLSSKIEILRQLKAEIDTARDALHSGEKDAFADLRRAQRRLKNTKARWRKEP